MLHQNFRAFFPPMFITWFLKHWCEAWWDYSPCYTWLTQKQRFIIHFSRLAPNWSSNMAILSHLHCWRKGERALLVHSWHTLICPQSTNHPRQGWGTAEDKQNSTFLVWHRKFCWGSDCDALLCSVQPSLLLLWSVSGYILHPRSWILINSATENSG